MRTLIGQPHKLAVDGGVSGHEARVAAVEIDQLARNGGLASLARVQHVSAFFTGQQGAVDEDVLQRGDERPSEAGPRWVEGRP